MAYTPVIYDWRPNLCQSSQLFVAGGQAVAGGLTLGGAAQSIPEPGGRASLSLGFPAFWSDPARNRDVSWTISALRNGMIFRIPLRPSFQLVNKSEIFGAAAAFHRTVTYSPPFNDPTGSAGVVWDPKVPVSVAASKGAVTVVIDMTGLAPVIDVGHVVGFRADEYYFAHQVTAISYAGETATLTVSPPLRRALTTSYYCLLRPTMLATCMNPDAVAGDQIKRSFQSLAPLTFVEALV